MKIPLKTITIRNRKSDVGYFGTNQVNVYYDTDKALVEAFTVPKDAIRTDSVGRGRYEENNSTDDENIYAVANGSNYTAIRGAAVYPERNRYYIMDNPTGVYRIVPFKLSTGEYVSSELLTLTLFTQKMAIDRQRDYFLVGDSANVDVYDFYGTQVETFSAGGTVADVFSTSAYYYSANTSEQIYRTTKGGSSSLLVDMSAFTNPPSAVDYMYVDETNEKIYVTDASDYVFVCSDLSGTEGTRIQLTGSATPTLGALTVDEEANILYVVDRSANNEVQIYDIGAGSKIGSTGTITGITGNLESHAFTDDNNLIYIQV